VEFCTSAAIINGLHACLAISASALPLFVYTFIKLNDTCIPTVCRPSSDAFVDSGRGSEVRLHVIDRLYSSHDLSQVQMLTADLQSCAPV